MKRKGKFITFEGLDGCGKTTQLEKLRGRLSTLCKPAGARKVFVTREPSDSIAGLLCRGIAKGSVLVQPETEALLYAADRYEHIQTEILPQLNSGNHVLCDRYYFSNFAYQCADSSLQDLLAYNRAAMELLRADVTIFIDLSPEACEKRRALERATEEKYEKLERARLTYAQYQTAFDLLREQENVLAIDGTGDADEVFEMLWIELTRTVFTKSDYQ